MMLYTLRVKKKGLETKPVEQWCNVKSMSTQMKF